MKSITWLLVLLVMIGYNKDSHEELIQQEFIPTGRYNCIDEKYSDILSDLLVRGVYAYPDCHSYHTCIYIHYFKDVLTHAFLMCAGQHKRFIPNNNTLFMTDPKTDSVEADRCNVRSDCVLVFDNKQSQFCTRQNIKQSYVLAPFVTLTVKYPICHDKTVWSEWLPCEVGLQYRYQLCTRGLLNQYQLRKCQKTTSTSSATSFTSSLSTETLSSAPVPTSIPTSVPASISTPNLTFVSISKSISASVYTTVPTSVGLHPTSSTPYSTISTSNLLVTVSPWLLMSTLSTSLHTTSLTYKSTTIQSTPTQTKSWLLKTCISSKPHESNIIRMSTMTTKTSPVVIVTTRSTSSHVMRSRVTPTKLYCEYEEVGDDSYKGKYVFPKTEIYQTATFQCKYGNLQSNQSTDIERLCVHDKHGNIEWEKLNLSTCSAKYPASNDLFSLMQDPVTSENVLNISLKLEDILSTLDSIKTPSDVDNIVEITENCIQYAIGDIKASHSLFRSIETMMNFDKNILHSTESTAHFLNHLNLLAEGLLESNESVKFSSKNLAFAKLNFPNNHNIYITSQYVNAKQDIIMKDSVDAQEINLENSDVDIFIPRSTWYDQNATIMKVYSFSFANDRLFVTRNNSSTNDNKLYSVGSKVLSATVYKSNIENLSQPIELKFNNIQKLDTVNCSFWDDTGDGHYADHWSSKGCYRSSITYNGNTTSVVCKCNHLTNFAILISPDLTNYRSVELDVISLIGCILSIVALSATIGIYVCFRELHKSIPQKILINLCFSLLVLLLVFIIGIEKNTSASLCHAMSALIHFFTLTTFSWMAVECISLYRSVVTVLRRGGCGKRFFRISFLLAWGVPGVIAGATSHFTWKQFDKDTNLCIIKGNAFFITTVFPVAFTLFMNIVLFIPIIRKIHNHLSTKEKFQKKKDYRRRARVTISCMVLLGLTWIAGIFAIGDMGIPLQWIFTLLNSVQGLFIFVFHVILKYEVQQVARRICGAGYRKYSISRLTSYSSKSGTIRLNMF